MATDLQDEGLQAYVEIDREAAGRLGVTPAAIDNALYNAFGQRLISTIFTQSSQYRVVLEVKPEFQRGPRALEGLYVSGPRGCRQEQVCRSTRSRRVSPSGIATPPRRHQSRGAVSRRRRCRSTSLPACRSADAVDAIRAAEARGRRCRSASRPASRARRAAFRASLTSTLFLLLAAVVTMYIVLGVLYESYIHPMTILSTLPSAGLGALLALLIVGLDLDIIAIIGIVLLIGIVKKNAIMMIDFALDAEREQGMAPRDAIHQACLLRFRPIMMTTFAALLGALPLMLGTGVGLELRHPLGVTMVGGLHREPDADAVHDAGDLPGLRTQRAHRLAAVARTPRREPPRRAGCRMNISAPFIARPVATTLLTIGLALRRACSRFGCCRSRRCRRWISRRSRCSASLPGASPDTMAATVATPLERALGTHRRRHRDHLVGRWARPTSRCSSTSTATSTARRATCRPRSTPRAALLPSGLPSNPTYRKVNPADAPIMILALTSNTLTRGQMYDAASTVLAQRLSQVEGVGAVNVGGGALPAVRVELDPDKLAAKGIRSTTCASPLTSTNANRPKGSVEEDGRYWQIGANDQARTAAEYAPVVG